MEDLMPDIAEIRRLYYHINQKGDDLRSSPFWLVRETGLANPYLRALLGAIILCSACAQMIAVAGNSKGFGIFMLKRNKGDPNKFGSPLFGARNGT